MFQEATGSAHITRNAMERGVYLTVFGDLTELAAVDHAKRVVRRVTVRTDLYTERELVDMEAWLDRLTPRPAALRLV